MMDEWLVNLHPAALEYLREVAKRLCPACGHPMKTGTTKPCGKGRRLHWLSCPQCGLRRKVLFDLPQRLPPLKPPRE